LCGGELVWVELAVVGLEDVFFIIFLFFFAAFVLVFVVWVVGECLAVDALVAGRRACFVVGESGFCSAAEKGLSEKGG
jgi:hypothetical protein